MGLKEQTESKYVTFFVLGTKDFFWKQSMFLNSDLLIVYPRLYEGFIFFNIFFIIIIIIKNLIGCEN